MGNVANKQLDETTVESGPFTASTCISDKLLSSFTVTLKNKGKSWVDSDGNLLWKSASKGVFKCHGIVMDADGKAIAVSITQKMGMASVTNYICKDTPSFKGQQALSEEELEKAGIEKGTTLYKFSKISVTRGLSEAKGDYFLVTKDGEKLLFTAEKLAAMNFLALFHAGDKCFAKAYVKGMSFSPSVDFGPSTDYLAVVCVGYALLGDGSSVGALAGAGVI